MNVFLDANILVSVLNKEYPLFTYSSRILSLTNGDRFQMYTSPVCLAIAFYFAEKKSGTSVAKRKIKILVDHIHVAPTDKEIVMNTIEDKKVNDFEDGLEYYSAVQSKCKCIITENREDFHFSRMEVLSSLNFLEKYVI
jgi:predicted nucleic acid-binding protein